MKKQVPRGRSILSLCLGPRIFDQTLLILVQVISQVIIQKKKWIEAINIINRTNFKHASKVSCLFNPSVFNKKAKSIQPSTTNNMTKALKPMVSIRNAESKNINEKLLTARNILINVKVIANVFLRMWDKKGMKMASVASKINRNKPDRYFN